MSPDLLSRRTIAFVNIAHALDHFVLLIYPTDQHSPTQVMDPQRAYAIPPTA
jgi:hypothetical protein